MLNPADESIIGAAPRRLAMPISTMRSPPPRRASGSGAAPRRAARAEIMLRAAALMRERIEEIARSITLEHGKPLAQARLEVVRGCEFFEWDAAEGQRAYGRVIPSEPGIRYLVIHQPVGTVAAFSPWNFPMSQPCRKIAGALAAGCSIIIKAAEETPAGALHIARALHDAGVPPGVVNLVFGVPAKISSLSHSAGTDAARRLHRLDRRRQAPARSWRRGHMTPVLMELGGHAPVIVCDDVDPVAAAHVSAIRKVRNAGQVCTSPTRFFVQPPEALAGAHRRGATRGTRAQAHHHLLRDAGLAGSCQGDCW